MAPKPKDAAPKTAAPKSEDADKDRALNLYQKLAAITGEVGVIAKDGNNKEQKYAFIEYEAIAGKLRTLFAHYGIVIVPQISSQERIEITSKYGSKGYHTLAKLTFEVVNADKPDDRFTVSWESEAADFGDKATNKAVTAALKYYLMRQFNISSKGDEDADSVSPEIKNEGNAQQPAPTPERAPVEPTYITKDQTIKLSQALIAKGVSTPQARMATVAALCGKDPTDETFDLAQLPYKAAVAVYAKVTAASKEALAALLESTDTASVAPAPAAPAADPLAQPPLEV